MWANIFLMEPDNRIKEKNPAKWDQVQGDGILKPHLSDFTLNFIDSYMTNIDSLALDWIFQTDYPKIRMSARTYTRLVSPMLTQHKNQS